MAIYFELGVDDASISVTDCAKRLLRELQLTPSASSSPMRLYNDGVGLVLRRGDPSAPGERLSLEAFGFAPTLHVSFRPILGGPNMELGVKTMMRVVNLILCSTTGDAGFASEYERVLILRRNGRLYARDDFENYLNSDRLDMISLPCERKALRP